MIVKVPMTKHGQWGTLLFSSKFSYSNNLARVISIRGIIQSFDFYIKTIEGLE